MTKLRDFVSKLTLAECQQIHVDYDEFEKKGVTGETTLRLKTEEFVANNPDSTESVAFVLMADQLIKEVWRRFATPMMEIVPRTSEDSSRYPYTLSCDAMRAAGLGGSRSESSSIRSDLAEFLNQTDKQFAVYLAEKASVALHMEEAAERMRGELRSTLRDLYSAVFGEVAEDTTS